MNEDFETVDDEEEAVTEEIITEETEVDIEEVVRDNIEKEDWGRPFTLTIWLSKLERLRRILREELKIAKGLEEEAIADSLKEVEREIRYVRCWLERAKPCGGAKEPWRIYQLLKRYGLL